MFTAILNALGFGQQQQHNAGGALSLFLAGQSIPQAAAATYGGGENLIAGQRWAEAEVRAYIASLENEIAELQRALDDCARG